MNVSKPFAYIGQYFSYMSFGKRFLLDSVIVYRGLKTSTITIFILNENNPTLNPTIIISDNMLVFHHRCSSKDFLHGYFLTSTMVLEGLLCHFYGIDHSVKPVASFLHYSKLTRGDFFNLHKFFLIS